MFASSAARGRNTDLPARNRRRAPSIFTWPGLVYTNTMFGIRVLLFVIGIALVVVILKRLATGSKPVAGPRREQVGKMVQCHHCGLYLPQQDAIEDSGRYYCSQDHLREDRDKGR